MEILIVIALIGILATLTFTLGERVRERGKVSQARVELAILSTALESFKSRYGDYPQTGGYTPAGPDRDLTALETDDAESLLFNSLFGVYDSKLELLEKPSATAGVKAYVLGKVFVEGARFVFERGEDAPVVAGDNPPFPVVAGTPARNAFLDPWGRRYQYYYRNKTDTTPPLSWTHPGFVLYSAGSDGKDVPPSPSGDPGYSGVGKELNIDNLYAGRN